MCPSEIPAVRFVRMSESLKGFRTFRTLTGVGASDISDDFGQNFGRIHASARYTYGRSKRIRPRCSSASETSANLLRPMPLSAHAGRAACVVPAHPAVALILDGRGLAQIFQPVVQSVAVDVID